ncbi:hypothetical protein A2U01_0117254, partial [Trifolium medium]|nr:hypothetical protein [Trifolium medium]
MSLEATRPRVPPYLPPRSSLGVGRIRRRSDHSALAVASWE